MRLLIVEDDRALAMFLTRGMEADGHRVLCAGDGAEAVDAFRNEMPDLTILDLNLPIMDGEQALAEMRVLDPQLPVLVLTGRQEVDMVMTDGVAAENSPRSPYHQELLYASALNLGVETAVA